MKINKSINLSRFPSFVKMADATLVFKKGSRPEKDNYRPVSILPNLSKVFQWYWHK